MALRYGNGTDAIVRSSSPSLRLGPRVRPQLSLVLSCTTLKRDRYPRENLFIL
jgi:hypothetical protein